MWKAGIYMLLQGMSKVKTSKDKGDAEGKEGETEKPV
jgi:hypothetical protein